MRQLIRTYTITGLHEITITGYTFTKEDVRLIIDETIAITDKRASVLVSSTAKNNIVSVVNGIITLASTTANLTVGDELTIEIDIDNVAKESKATINKLTILDALAAAKLAIQGNDAAATLLALKTAIANLPTVALIQNGLAKTTDIPTVQQILNGLAKTSELPTGYALDSTVAKEATLGDVAEALDYIEAGGLPSLLNVGIPTMTIPATTAAQELAPNTLYIFAERSDALTLTLGTPVVGVANEYHFFLITDSNTAPTITWPTGISWYGGNAPTIAAGKTYEVSILNNVAVYFEV